MSTPKLERGLYRVDMELHGVCLVCDFEIEEGERGSREGGLQMEPDIEPDATLCHAWVGDVDVAELISLDDIRALECYVLEMEEEV